MALYEFRDNGIELLAETTFSAVGLRERGDLQRLLKGQIEIIAPDTMVICEEFGDWDGSWRRIDLLGLDKDANLVVGISGTWATVPSECVKSCDRPNSPFLTS